MSKRQLTLTKLFERKKAKFKTSPDETESRQESEPDDDQTETRQESDDQQPDDDQIETRQESDDQQPDDDQIETRQMSDDQQPDDDQTESRQESDYQQPASETENPDPSPSQSDGSFKRSTSPEDPFFYTYKTLNDVDRTKLLAIEKSASSNTTLNFPATDGRRYNACWEEKYAWLRYSNEKDSAICVYCLAFGTRRINDAFASKGFKDWKNATGSKRGMLNIHSQSKNHVDASSKALGYKQIVSDEKTDICVKLSTSYEDKVKRNREILKRIIDIIIVLGQQNIPLRGHHWDKETKAEDGNFSRFLRWKADDVGIIKDHLEKASYNAKYTSPEIQNELIELAGRQVRESIIQEVKEAK